MEKTRETTRFNLDELDEKHKFLVVSSLYCAIYFKELGNDEEYFLKFSEEIWRTMELNGADILKIKLDKQMNKDLKSRVERLKEEHGMD